MVAQAVFQQCDVDNGGVLRYAYPVAEVADCLWRVAAPAKTRDRWHAGVVPAIDITTLHEEQQPALAEYGVAEVQPREFDLARLVHFKFLQEPVVQWAVVLIFHRAD